MIMPSIPISEPQIERESRMMAGFNPVIFPIILGVSMVSCMSCTTQNTIMASPSIHQKFSPVSAAFISASITVGIKPMICR